MFLKQAFLLLLAAPLAVAAQELTTVAQVDLNRYAGLWYEVAKIPNRFQRKCIVNTTAEYSLLSDGLIKVVNRCGKPNGRVNSVQGVAKVVDAQTNAKLKVSFVRFLRKNWFFGDYWIIGLDEEYRWAVVGTPGRKYGWILARTKTLDAETREKIDGILRQQGYDPITFVDSPHE